MPIYEFECDACGWVNDRQFPMDNRPNNVKCEVCGGYANFIISAPTGIINNEIRRRAKTNTEFKPYKLTSGALRRVESDPHFDHKDRGIWIQSRRHERDVMKKMDCHFGERGEKVQGFELGKDKPASGLKIRK